MFRDRRLTAQEIARDNEIHQKVQGEFPAAPPRIEVSGRLSSALKDALRTSDKSIYQIAQASGISQIVLSRFLSGERDIRMGTADKIAEALGLKIAKAS